MRRRWLCGWLGLLGLLGSLTATGRGDEPIGFVPAGREAQSRAEAHALGVPTPDAARSWLRTITKEPHVAGTPADHETALFVRDKLRSWGWQADLAEYEVMLNYPVGLPTLAITRPTPQALKVVEDAVNADKDSASPAAFPAFHGYGTSGDVTAQVVYVNYGRPEDYAALERLGIDVKGKIVLVRYGELFRGLKVRNAQKHGAIGILIYSDPQDDGYGKGDIFPQGPYRAPSSFQRGSVQFLSLGPGDPSTPGVPSLKDAKRLPVDPFNGFTLSPQATSFAPEMMKPGIAIPSVAEWEKLTGLKRDDYFATIPSLPIAYESAQPILAALGGPNVPTGWQGGLPLAYHVGPGPVEVHLKIQQDYQVRTIWNVIAQIRGEVEPDRWVMIGNHRDAWVNGAVDPGSGSAATLEMARALGSAVKQGWKPKRTLVYASWDAEEYGLVGSTEWADQHAAEITDKAVLMLNVDVAVSGPDLDVDGVPSLRDLLLNAASGVQDVRSGRTLRDLLLAKKRAAFAASTAPVDLPLVWDAAPADPAGPAARAFNPQLNPLGSGSDYTAFLDHLGVPAMDAGFSGRYGVYHSIYDDFFWMEKFGDPEFVTHTTAARLYTLIVMRAAGADVVPLRFAPYADALKDYVDDLRRVVARKGRAAEGEAAPGAKPPVTFEGLARLIAAIRQFDEQARALDAATDALARRDGVSPAQFARVNDALTRVERAFLLPNGLPGRPWFKHAVYAPGLTTGYASWPLPGVRQGVLDSDAEMVAAQSSLLADRIDAATAALRLAAEAAAPAPSGSSAPPAPPAAPAAAPAAPVPAPPANPAPPSGARASGAGERSTR